MLFAVVRLLLDRQELSIVLFERHSTLLHCALALHLRRGQRGAALLCVPKFNIYKLSLCTRDAFASTNPQK